MRARAAPADGAANKAVLKTLARVLGVAQSRVELVSGTTSRTKRIAVEDVDPALLAARWPGLLTREG